MSYRDDSVDPLDEDALHAKIAAQEAKRHAVLQQRRAEQARASREYAQVYASQYAHRSGRLAPPPPIGSDGYHPSLLTEMIPDEQGAHWELSRWGVPQPSKARMAGNKAMGMGMGFMMGMFVGASVGMLHGFSPLLRRQPIREPIRNIVKRSVAGGSAFGVIFAVGSLFQ